MSSGRTSMGGQIIIPRDWKQKYLSWRMENELESIGYSQQDLADIYSVLTTNLPVDAGSVQHWKKAATIVATLRNQFADANHDTTPSLLKERADTQVLTWRDVKSDPRFAFDFYALTLALSDLTVAERISTISLRAGQPATQAFIGVPGVKEVTAGRLLVLLFGETVGISLAIGGAMILAERQIGYGLFQIDQLVNNPGPWAGIDSPVMNRHLEVVRLERQAQELLRNHQWVVQQVNQVLNSANQGMTITGSPDLEQLNPRDNERPLKDLTEEELCNLYWTVMASLLNVYTYKSLDMKTLNQLLHRLGLPKTYPRMTPETLSGLAEEIFRELKWRRKNPPSEVCRDLLANLSPSVRITSAAQLRKLYENILEVLSYHPLESLNFDLLEALIAQLRQAVTLFPNALTMLEYRGLHRSIQLLWNNVIQPAGQAAANGRDRYPNLYNLANRGDFPIP